MTEMLPINLFKVQKKTVEEHINSIKTEYQATNSPVTLYLSMDHILDNFNEMF